LTPQEDRKSQKKEGKKCNYRKGKSRINSISHHHNSEIFSNKGIWKIDKGKNKLQQRDTRHCNLSESRSSSTEGERKQQQKPRPNNSGNNKQK